MFDFLINLAQNGVETGATVAPDAGVHAETVQAVTETVHQASDPAGGLAALGLDWKAFLFQLITFVIVLLILRKFVFGKLVATLDARQKAVNDSIKNAEVTESKLKEAEKTIAAMIADARKEADSLIAASHKEAAQMVEAAEAKAVKRAEHIVAEAKSNMDIEVAKARELLKKETAQLVMAATEQVIRQKLDATKDAALINTAITHAGKERA